MSIFGSFFSPSQTTQGTQTTTQNSSFNNQSNSQNNLWPQLQPFYQQYASTAFNPAPFNSYQTNAADRQDNTAANLAPGFSAASNVAGSGIGSIQPWMSPYISSVVNPTMQAQDMQNKQALSNIEGNLATRGALGNTNNAATKALYYQSVLPQQQAQIAGLYDKGYNTAVDTAAKDAALRLQGSSTLGNLTGAATGANQAGFNIGQTLWQDPLNWMTQGASGLSPFLQGAGTSSSSSGSSTGTSTGVNNSTSMYNPSDFQAIAGILGLGASLIPGRRADGGVIKGYDAGGSVPATTGTIMPFQPGSDLPSKVASAFSTLNSITGAAKGGIIKGYNDGGSTPWSTTVSSFDPSSTMGDDIVGQATGNQQGMDFSAGMKRFGDAAMKQSGMGDDQSKMLSQANASSIAGLNNQASGLSSFMAQNQPKPIQAFAEGGIAGWEDGARPIFNDDTSGGVIPSFLGAPPAAGPPSLGMQGQPVPQGSPMSSGQPMTPVWGNIIDGLSKSPLISGDWTQGGGPAARPLLAASGPHIGGQMAQQASEMVKEAQARRAHDDLQKRVMAQMAQSDRHHADSVDYQNRALKQTGAHQAWQRQHGDMPEIARQMIEAGIQRGSDEWKRIMTEAIRGNDPVGQAISEQMRVLRPEAPVGGVQRQSSETIPSPPKLQPISDTQAVPGSEDPNLIRTQAAAPQGAPQQPTQETIIDTPVGPMPLSKAKQIGGLMLGSPKYKAMGEHILKQADKSDENRSLVTGAKTEVDKALVSGVNHLGRLEDIGRDFDPKYLTLPYRAGSAMGAGLEKMGLEMDPESKADREKYAQFRSKTAGNLNALLKELSGSAVTQNEYERMLIQEPNAGTGGMLDIFRGDNPTDFQSKLGTSKAMAKMAIARANWLRTSQNFSPDAIANMAKNGALSNYAPLDNMKKIMDDTQGQIMQRLKNTNPNSSDEQLIPAVRKQMNQIFGI